jgi:site-specific DNA-methyltransferase (adenine-specific)
VTSHYHILFVAKHKTKYYFNKVLRYPEDVWKIKHKDEDLIDFKTVCDDWDEEEDGDPLDFWVIKRPYNRGEIKVPNKLPPKLMRKILLFSSKPGDTILDTFGGGGSSIVGVIRLNKEDNGNRKAIIIEKSKPMYEFILSQIKKELGND